MPGGSTSFHVTCEPQEAGGPRKRPRFRQIVGEAGDGSHFAYFGRIEWQTKHVTLRSARVFFSSDCTLINFLRFLQDCIKDRPCLISHVHLDCDFTELFFAFNPGRLLPQYADKNTGLGSEKRTILSIHTALGSFGFSVSSVIAK